MQSGATIVSPLPKEVTLLLSTICITGIIAISVLSILAIVRLLWGLTYGIALILAHTSTTQLLLIIIVGYTMYKVGQTVKQKRIDQ